MNSLGPDSGVHNNLINVIRDITNRWALQLTNHFFFNCASQTYKNKC